MRLVVVYSRKLACLLDMHDPAETMRCQVCSIEKPLNFDISPSKGDKTYLMSEKQEPHNGTEGVSNFPLG